MKKIIIGILVLSIIVLSILGFIFFEIINLSAQSQRVESAGTITRSAMVFQNEVFLAKFEIWQYTHGLAPGDLDTFQKYNELLSQHIDKIMMLVRAQKASVYAGGLSDFNNIKNGLTVMQSNWQKVLVNIDSDQKISDVDKREASLNQLRATMDQELLKNGIFFDSQDFNDHIDSFVTAQENHLVQELAYIDSLHMLVQIGIVVLAGFYMILLAFIAVWLGGIAEAVKTHDFKNILNDLAKDEKMEKDFIVFYEMLMGQAGCLAESKRKEFTESLETLCNDSRRHYELINNIINKYE